MTTAQETPHPPVLQLIAGHFHETSGYRAYREHGVDDWLLIRTIDGRGRFGHAGGDLVAEPGDLVLLRPGTRHDYGVEATLQRWELLWVHFRPRADWLDLLRWPEVAPGLMVLHMADPAVAERLHEVRRLQAGALRRREAFAMNALEALLLGCDQHNTRPQAGALDHRIRRAMDYFDTHLTAPARLADVARAVGLSTSRLSHLFVASTGQTPQAYQEAQRMRAAIDLLRRTGFPIKQVAAAVGFDSPFYFSKRFSRWTGQSPTAFRQNEIAARASRSYPCASGWGSCHRLCGSVRRTASG